MSLRLLALFAAAWLCTAVCATVPPPPGAVQKQGAATAWYPPTLPLADEGTITLRVVAPGRLQVEVLAKPKTTPQWSLETDGQPTLREPQGKGEAVWEQKYLLAPHKDGKHAVELPPLRYRCGTGAWQTVTWKPVPVHVTAEIKNVEPGAARDITSIEELPQVEPARGWVLWAGLGLGAMLLGVTAFVVGRRRSVKPPTLLPHEWALRELERLAARCPASGEENEAYHTALSGVLRHYLQGRFLVPAERQTTAEFLEAARKVTELTAEQQTTLAEMLTRCDLAKFARVWPSPEECQELVTRARGFVEETAPKPAAR